jgi:hypothetical protein
MSQTAIEKCGGSILISLCSKNALYWPYIWHKIWFRA